MKRIFWMTIGVGMWLVISPWVLGFSEVDLAVWNSVFLGAIVLLFAFRMKER